jgi:hypothetical protein
MTFFWVKFFVNGPKVILHLLKNKIIFKVVIFVATTKKVGQQILFHPSLFVADLGSGIDKIRIRIRDKHSGSATLPLS